MRTPRRLRKSWDVAARLFAGVGVVCFVLVLSARWLMMTPEHLAGPGGESRPELTILTYRSLVGKSGLGSVLFPRFEKKYHCRVRVLTQPDGGALLTRLEIDARRRQFPAQVVLGLDQYLFEKARTYLENWDGWVPEGYAAVQEDLRLGNGFLPYDFGPLGWMVDQVQLQASGLSVPHRLEDLLDPKWARRLLLQDPRTSTPGLTFVLYTHEVLGSQFQSFWSGLRSQWLTLAPNWESAYRLFAQEEAPVVWSYLTSQAYQETHGEGSRYQAVVFQEGQPFQVEGAGLIRGAFESGEQRALAQFFLEFLISPEVQELIPHSAWMMPVLKHSRLPVEFLRLPNPVRRVWPSRSPDQVQRVLTDWRRAVES